MEIESTLLDAKQMKVESRAFFAPHLTLKDVAAGMDYYSKAFGAVELRRWSNDDGSVHVAEMQLLGQLFHLHEESPRNGEFCPVALNGVPSLIGMFVPDPDALIISGEKFGGRIQSPPADYDYGYRQGTLIDPFGHHWLFQKVIPPYPVAH